jgi:hypothetical protein
LNSSEFGNAALRSEDAIRDDIELYFRLTGHAPPASTRLTTAETRAVSTPDSTPPWADFSTDPLPWKIFHESGHFIEYEDPTIASATRSFRLARAAERAGGRALPEPERLFDLTNDAQHGLDEVARRGMFRSFYTGREYGSGPASEIVTTALQTFTDPLEMRKFFAVDPEHFFLLMGILRRTRISFNLR